MVLTSPRALQLLPLLALAGCLSAPSLRTAHPTPKGQWDLQLNQSFHYIPLEGSRSTAGIGTSLAWRIGVADNADFGFGLHTLGARADARIRLTQHELLNLAVSPGAYVLSMLQDRSGGGSSVEAVSGANLIGLLTLGRAGTGASFTAFFGPEVAVTSGVTGALARYGGGFRFWVTRGFAIHPEFEMLSDMNSGFAVSEASLTMGFVWR